MQALQTGCRAASVLALVRAATHMRLPVRERVMVILAREMGKLQTQNNN